MKIKILNDTHNKLVFIAKWPIALANSLVRIMIANVETYAIGSVEFYENSTVIPDEMLAHRIGLIPILYNGNDNVYFDFEYKCENKSKTMVCSSLLKPSCNELKVALLDPDYPTAYIPIVYAVKGQSLKFRAFVEKGCGEIHNRFSPVSLCFCVETKEGIKFTIETIGQLTPKQVVMEGIKKLREIVNF